MITLVLEPSDHVTVPTNTASIVGKPYRCVMIHRSTTISCLILHHQSLLRAVLHTRQPTNPTNTPNTKHNNQQPPTPTTTED